MGSVRVALKYEQFLCTVPIFCHENTKVDTRKFDVNNYVIMANVM